MKKTPLLFTLFICFNLFGQKEIYEIRSYELFQSSNINNLNTYFKDHFIPTLNQNGIKNIGVFKEVSEDLPRKIYVFIPYATMKTYEKTLSVIASDKNLQKASVALNPRSNPVFNRYQTSFFVETLNHMTRMLGAWGQYFFTSDFWIRCVQGYR